jgi:hypothetical protein
MNFVQLMPNFSPNFMPHQQITPLRISPPIQQIIIRKYIVKIDLSSALRNSINQY